MASRDGPRSEGKVIGLEEACAVLGISLATGKNWVRLGKLTPSGPGPAFDAAEIENYSETRRKSRAPTPERKILRGRELYLNYVDRSSPNHFPLGRIVGGFKGTKNALTALLAESALQLLKSAGLIKTSYASHLCAAYIRGDVVCDEYTWLIEELMGSSPRRYILTHAEELTDFRLTYVPFEDTLGLIYLTLSEILSKHEGGHYYTPQSLTDTAVETVSVLEDRTFLDPSCGSGNFLMRLLKRGAGVENLYGCDLDSVSVNLARLNFALYSRNPDRELLCRHILQCDTILRSDLIRPDVIIGNPPWGRCENAQTVKRYSRVLKAAQKPRPDYAALFVERALQLLPPGGLMQFVLPEALLNVNTHKEIRALISQKARVKAVRYLGEVFHAVQCPSIVLTLERTAYPNAVGEVIVNIPDTTYIVRRERAAGDFNFKVSDQEFRLLDKLDGHPRCVKLKGHADFALGIVTGQNRGLLLSTREPGSEGVLRGADIEPYSIREPGAFLFCEPKRFQQIAPMEYYRAPLKLVYRFIARWPIVAIDTKARLTLNSCNVLVPRFKEISPYYLCAVLNSSVMRFYFEKRYHTLKVLKSQLENVPIPLVSEEAQLEIEFMVRELDECSDGEHGRLIRDLDRKIADFYGLGKRECKLAGVG